MIEDVKANDDEAVPEITIVERDPKTGTKTPITIKEMKEDKEKEKEKEPSVDTEESGESEDELSPPFFYDPNPDVPSIQDLSEFGIVLCCVSSIITKDAIALVHRETPEEKKEKRKGKMNVDDEEDPITLPILDGISAPARRKHSFLSMLFR